MKARTPHDTKTSFFAFTTFVFICLLIYVSPVSTLALLSPILAFQLDMLDILTQRGYNRCHV